MNTEFIRKFIKDRRHNREDTLDFLKSINETNSYIAGEYIVQLLNNYKKKRAFMDLYIHHNRILEFIVLNINNINDLKLYFEKNNNNIFTIIRVVDNKRFKYRIIIVPNDINIIDYIKLKAVLTTSEIWFNNNKIEGTNLELIQNNKCFLKEEYLNRFIDKLDKKIISIIQQNKKRGFDVEIDTTTYNKKEIEKDIVDLNKSSILSFLVSFYNNMVLSEQYNFSDTIIKYPEDILTIFSLKNKQNLFNSIHYILCISKYNKYSKNKLILSFNNAYKIDLNKLIDIVNILKDKEIENSRDYFIGEKAKIKIKFLDILLSSLETLLVESLLE
jgi:hypothetical protein